MLNGGTATAVSLTNNTGATINFTGGGLDIDATSGGGLHATGGGTVTVTGHRQHDQTGTGTALNVVNVNIGAADLTFESISKNGTGTGIVLNNTGAAGSLTVTGDSGSANNNSGGTIQNATIGISLTDTRDVVLDQMNIHDMTQNGIDGFHVTNFTLTNSKVETTGTASIAGDYEVNAISFMDRSGANDNTIDGTITITGNTITNPERNAISIETWAGTISNVNISNNTISGGTTNARIQDAVHVFAQGTTGGITTGTISNNAISDFRFFDTAPVIDIFVGGNGIRLVTDTNAVNPASTLGTTPNPFVISDNDIDNVGSNMIAVTAVGRTASANVRILNNGTLGDPMNNAEGLGISLFFGGNGTFNGLIHNNVLQNIDQGANPSGSSGIGVQSDFGGNTGANTDVTNSNITVTNNRVTDMSGNGIIATGINNAGTFNIRINDNVVTTIPDLRRPVRDPRWAQQRRHAADHQPRDARQRHRGRQPDHRASRWARHPPADWLHVLHRGGEPVAGHCERRRRPTSTDRTPGKPRRCSLATTSPIAPCLTRPRRSWPPAARRRQWCTLTRCRRPTWRRCCWRRASGGARPG